VDVQKTFRDAEDVKGQVVFDVAGNKCRLIAIVNYQASLVQIERVDTHAEYDRGKWKK
jgi:mRNA interferase HigB